MVEPPKSLHDLRRVEGAVRVTCRTCGHVALLDREELIGRRGFHRQSCDWELVRRDLPCQAPSCDSKDVRVDGVPFGQNDAELRRQRAAMLLMNLALQVLSAAARDRGAAAADRAAVRLALRVLHPYVGDQELLAAFWRAVTETTDHPWSGAQQAQRWIVAKLVARGHAVWAELR